MDESKIINPKALSALVRYSFMRSQWQINEFTKCYTMTERAFKEYKKACEENVKHDLWVKTIRDKKKARRLRNKAKGPRK